MSWVKPPWRLYRSMLESDALIVGSADNDVYLIPKTLESECILNLMLYYEKIDTYNIWQRLWLSCGACNIARRVAEEIRMIQCSPLTDDPLRVY